MPPVFIKARQSIWITDRYRSASAISLMPIRKEFYYVDKTYQGFV